MLAKSYGEVAELFIPIALAIIPSRYCFIGELSDDEPERLDILAVSHGVISDHPVMTLGAESLDFLKVNSGLVTTFVDEELDLNIVS